MKMDEGQDILSTCHLVIFRGGAHDLMSSTTQVNRPGELLVTLRLIWLDPPPRIVDNQPAVVGMPDASKFVYSGTPRADGAESYLATVRVRPRQDDAPPDFAGPFVHGPKGERFLYLGWRHADGHWIRRWKIMLDAITWTQIEEVAATPQSALQATMRGGNRARVSFEDNGWKIYEG